MLIASLSSCISSFLSPSGMEASAVTSASSFFRASTGSVKSPDLESSPAMTIEILAATSSSSEKLANPCFLAMPSSSVCSAGSMLSPASCSFGATVARSGWAEMKLFTCASVSLICLIGSSFGSCARAGVQSAASAEHDREDHIVVVLPHRRFSH